MYKAQFTASIHTENWIKLTLFSKEDDHSLTPLCTPMNYGTFVFVKIQLNSLIYGTMKAIMKIIIFLYFLKA
ncbi:hypothetical protein J2W55_005156 [Mucilaginibacter pocheonensis]|uniref:Uncharacterized protein n=1 Tax=Mucilaginibacter pocheonensis TaxID=398050 RepID=A0ABU1TIQ2_9SPHI|nr:hypothetical protein [Mucilaginibacter pocheonensis]